MDPRGTDSAYRDAYNDDVEESDARDRAAWEAASWNDRRDLLHHLSVLYRNLVDAEAKCALRSDARRLLPPGSPRARVTTANARWSTACEHRDRIEKTIRMLRDKDGRLP